MGKLKVLLVSPVENHDVYCGDVIYTQLLEKNPPDNVEYVNYVQAQQKGLILERKRLRYLPVWWKENKLIFFLDMIPSLLIAFLNIFRRANLLIANPWKFIYIKADFDLVHCHVFPIALSGKKTPLVISNAITSALFLRHVRKIPDISVWFMKTCEIILCRLFGVQESSLTVNRKTPVILFSKALIKEYKYLPEKNISIVPIGLPGLKTTFKKPLTQVFHLGFIAKDFDLKGGNELIKAYKAIKQKYGLKTTLTIVGSKPLISAEEQKQLAINWHNFIPRNILLNKVAPNWDLFIYPTRSDGFPLVVLEMLALGIPCVVSNFLALPEMIGNNYAGLVCKISNPIDLAQKIEKMLNKKVLLKYRLQAKKLFAEKYDQKVTNKLLMDCYNKTIKRSKIH